MPQSPVDRAARLFTLLFLACLAIVATALVLQHRYNLDPCPWCIAQRLGYLAFALVALVAALHRPTGRGITVYSGLALFVALSGVAAATWHVFLQRDPERAQACTGSWLERALDASRIGHWVPPVLQYDGPCTLKPWALFGLSVPELSLIGFVVLALASISLPFIARR
jgi:disulfide bond formation protein DsbB